MSKKSANTNIIREVTKGNGHLKIRIDDLQTFEPLTDNQKKFFDAYKRGDYFLALLGSPGVGKTFLALLKSLEEVLDKSKSFQKVVVIRSAVQVRDQGFVPGTLEEKMAMYETPYIDICATLFKRKDAWQRLREQSHVEFISTTAIRGMTFDDAILIVDEAANLSWMEISAVMTRVGYRSKIIICGDLFQNDLIKNKNDTSGLSKFLDVARCMSEFSEINFTPDDIIRSSLTKNFIIACQNKGLIPSQ